MTAPIAPGVVTGLSPFRVKLDTDKVAQPCQRVALAQVGQSGGVLIWGGQRVWLGQYDAADLAAMLSAIDYIVSVGQNRNSALRSAISALESTVNTGSNRNSLLRSDLNALTARVAALEAATADTGWQAITPVTGVTGPQLAYRVIGRQLHLQGAATRSSGWTASYLSVGSVPVAYAPPSLTTQSVPAYDPVQGAQCAINTAGLISVRIGTPGATVADLGGVSYIY